MRADRAAAGFSGAAILVVIALSPGGTTVREPMLLALAGLFVVGTFAPVLPLLHRLPLVGEPKVTVVVTFGGDGLTQDALLAGATILRVAFENHGPRRVRDTLINVVVSNGLDIEATDWRGTQEPRGGTGPPTILDDQPANYWIEKDVALVVGANLKHYRLSVARRIDVTEFVKVRLAYSSDDLYGKKDRVHIHRERVAGFRSPKPILEIDTTKPSASSGSSSQREVEPGQAPERGEEEGPTHA